MPNKLIPNLSDEVNSRLEKCCREIEKILDEYFPEFKKSYGEDNFHNRLFMSMYLEMIHAGFFNKEKCPKCNHELKKYGIADSLLSNEFAYVCEKCNYKKIGNHEYIDSPSFMEN